VELSLLIFGAKIGYSSHDYTNVHHSYAPPPNLVHVMHHNNDPVEASSSSTLFPQTTDADYQQQQGDNLFHNAAEKNRNTGIVFEWNSFEAFEPTIFLGVPKTFAHIKHEIEASIGERNDYHVCVCIMLLFYYVCICIHIYVCI